MSKTLHRPLPEIFGSPEEIAKAIALRQKVEDWVKSHIALLETKLNYDSNNESLQQELGDSYKFLMNNRTSRNRQDAWWWLRNKKHHPKWFLMTYIEQRRERRMRNENTAEALHGDNDNHETCE